MHVRMQASTLGLIKELHQQGYSQGSKVLCPVPFVTGGLSEPPVVPRFLEGLKVRVQEHYGLMQPSSIHMHNVCQA